MDRPQKIAVKLLAVEFLFLIAVFIFRNV